MKTVYPIAEIDYDLLPEKSIKAVDLRTLIEAGVKNSLMPWEIRFREQFSASNEALNQLYEQTVKNYTDTIMEVVAHEIYMK